MSPLSTGLKTSINTVLVLHSLIFQGIVKKFFTIYDLIEYMSTNMASVNIEETHCNITINLVCFCLMFIHFKLCHLLFSC